MGTLPLLDFPKGKGGAPIKIVGGLPWDGDRDRIVAQIGQEIQAFLDEWIDAVAKTPGRTRAMEWAALRLCARFAGLVIALVFAARRVGEAAEEQGLAARPPHVRPPRQVKRFVKLPGDLRIQVETAYCPPQTGRRIKGKRRSREGGGLYPALAALGIFEGMSALAADLALRFSLLMPSFDRARDELEMLGHRYGLKAVRRIVADYGAQALAVRRHAVEDWRAGRLKPGTELRGRRVVVSVDGGRARVRVKRKRNRRGKKRKYSAPWREPKLMIIYTINQKGRRDSSFPAQIDATLRGPDVAMELLAYHLFRLGAAEAECVEFIADGAPWIWDRLDAVIAKAGLNPARCRKVLDFYHAVEHLSAALEACALSDTERKKWLTRLRRKLKAGKAAEMIAFLQRQREGGKANRKAMAEQIAYFQKRIPLLDYGRFRRCRLALGSGAVESAVRRVINLRVKSPSMFWDEPMLEGMIYMRAQILSERWDEMMDQVRDHARFSRTRDTVFTPTPMVDLEDAA